MESTMIVCIRPLSLKQNIYWWGKACKAHGSNANYDRWLRDSVISYVTFTFLSFILERMILCDLFWLASLFTKVTSGKSSHFLIKIQTIQSLVKGIFWYINIFDWCHSSGRKNSVLKDPLKVCVCSNTCLMLYISVLWIII